MTRLSAKREAFCREYTVDGNAARAAARAQAEVGLEVGDAWCGLPDVFETDILLGPRMGRVVRSNCVDFAAQKAQTRRSSCTCKV